MITKEELKEYSESMNLNLGQAESDYFQNVFLFLIYRHYGKDVVFKGGTALKKCYGLDRFSEDLDFTTHGRIDIKKVESGLKNFKLDFKTKKDIYEDEQKFIFKIKGPLYSGTGQSLCKLVLDFSLREAVILKPNIKTIGRFLEELPMFDVFVMKEKEILAEKIRAILTREICRDVYDVWFLLNKGIEIDKSLVNKKLEFYDEQWDENEFKKKINQKKKNWHSELKPLIKTVPDFNKVKKDIFKAI